MSSLKTVKPEQEQMYQILANDAVKTKIQTMIAYPVFSAIILACKVYGVIGNVQLSAKQGLLAIYPKTHDTLIAFFKQIINT
jgi:hypothetical protein